MKTDFLLKSPLVFTFGLLFSLVACNNQKSPAAVTMSFWAAVAKNELQLAKEFCITQNQPEKITFSASLNNKQFSYGKIIINGNQATVETIITAETENQRPSFTTFLLKEGNQWKIDCKRSIDNLSNPLNSFLNKLNNLGETLNEKLEQQIPLIEKELESFGHELKRQIDNLGNELEKPIPQNQEEPYHDTI